MLFLKKVIMNSQKKYKIWKLTLIKVKDKQKYKKIYVFGILVYKKRKQHEDNNIFYVRNAPLYAVYYNKTYLNNKQLDVTIIEKGIVLPLRLDNESGIWGNYKGGVVDANYNFVAGIERRMGHHTISPSCLSAYEYNKKDVKYFDEEVIFGGILFPMWGHFFCESLARFWYVLQNKSQQKIVCLVYNNQIKEYFYELFELMNIEREQIIFISEISQFKKIIIPEQCIVPTEYYTQEFKEIFSIIRSNISPAKYKKVYLTRTKLTKQDCLNESYFEKFFVRQGFKVIAPEMHSVKEQISILAGAKEIVCTTGTLSNMILFAQPKTKLVCLNRISTEEFSVALQPLINQVAENKFQLVNISNNFLPVTHSGRVFLIRANKYWKEFLQNNNYHYKPKDIEFNIKDFFEEYCQRWIENYSSSYNYNFIKSKTPQDFITTLKSILVKGNKK